MNCHCSFHFQHKNRMDFQMKYHLDDLVSPARLCDFHRHCILNQLHQQHLYQRCLHRLCTGQGRVRKRRERRKKNKIKIVFIFKMICLCFVMCNLLICVHTQTYSHIHVQPFSDLYRIILQECKHKKRTKYQDRKKIAASKVWPSFFLSLRSAGEEKNRANKRNH